MYRRGHVRNSDSKRQVRYGAPMFTLTAAERVEAWEKKIAAAKAAKEASK